MTRTLKDDKRIKRLLEREALPTFECAARKLIKAADSLKTNRLKKQIGALSKKLKTSIGLEPIVIPSFEGGKETILRKATPKTRVKKRFKEIDSEDTD